MIAPICTPLFSDDGTPWEHDFTPAQMAEAEEAARYEPEMTSYRKATPREVAHAYTRGPWRARRDIDAMLADKQRELTEWLHPLPYSRD